MSFMIGAEKDRIQNHPNTIDAGAVIEACVDLLTNAAHADLLDRRTPGDSPQLPSVIRKLEAMNVFVASNGVEIQMSGGHFQSGYFFNRTPTNYSLWYGDESGTTNRELANIHREIESPTRRWNTTPLTAARFTADVRQKQQ